MLVSLNKDLPMKSRSLRITTLHHLYFKTKPNLSRSLSMKKKHFFFLVLGFPVLLHEWKRWLRGSSFQSGKLRRWNKILWLEQRIYRLICICCVLLSGNSTRDFSFSLFVGGKDLVEVTIVRSPLSCLSLWVNLWCSQQYKSLGCFETHLLW